MGFMDEFNFWLKDDYFDQDTKTSCWLSGITKEKSRNAFTRSWSSEPEVCAALSAREPTA